MGVVDGGRRFETHYGVGRFIIILGIQVESSCLAVCSLLYTDVTDSLMVDYVFFLMVLLLGN